MIIEVLRNYPGITKPDYQSFEYAPQSGADTVATALTYLSGSAEITDINGNPARPVRWDCSCLQKKCGACAMLINGSPTLACSARLGDLGEKVRLEPLKKFPVIEDLAVDRDSLFRALDEMKVWFKHQAASMGKSEDISYEASRCLQCGCCLEVCPNFAAGGKFPGMAAAVPMARLLARLPDEQKKEASSLYEKRIFEGCGKSLACRNICPAKIDIDRMLVNSNAIAVWKRYLK